jgi:hypothetical protein
MTITSHDTRIAELTETVARLAATIEHSERRYRALERLHRRIVAAALGLIVLGLSAGSVLMVTGDADAEGGGPGLGGLVESAAEADVHWVARELGLLEDDTIKHLRVAGQAVDADLEKAQTWETQKAQAMVEAYRNLEKGFDPGAAIALFLGEMQETLKAMPAMRDDMDAMRIAMEQMNMKMSAMPVMAGEMQAMSARIGVMTYGIDSTMGRTGRMVPFMPW